MIVLAWVAPTAISFLPIFLGWSVMMVMMIIMITMVVIMVTMVVIMVTFRKINFRYTTSEFLEAKTHHPEECLFVVILHPDDHQQHIFSSSDFQLDVKLFFVFM